MAVQLLDFFYDAQIERWLRQVIRAFSCFQIQEGYDNSGQPRYMRVPAIFGDFSRQGGAIVRNNTENVVMSAPYIGVYINSLRPNNEDLRAQDYVEHLQVVEREFDTLTQGYTDQPGNAYHVQRITPKPIIIEYKVDVWCTNEVQRLQLFEQMYPVFYRSIDIQNSVNPLDWTALSMLELKDFNYRSTSIPAGTDSNQIDYFTLTLEQKTNINVAAKVQRQQLIHTIINNVLDQDTEDDLGSVVVTTGNYQIRVQDNRYIYLLTGDGQEDSSLSWQKLISRYGPMRPGYSTLRIRTTTDIEEETSDMIGTFDYHPELINVLDWSPDIDTLPGATLDPIDAIINPHTAWPGGRLPPAATGQRYLLTDEIGGPTVAWGNLSAVPNSIIQYDGTYWLMVFNPANAEEEIVINTTTNTRLRFYGNEWIDAINMQVAAGFWRIVI